MAVTKTSVVSLLLVLAITYNQGAARPMACTTAIGSGSSEEYQLDCKYKIPTVIRRGLRMNITGTIYPNATNKALIVELSKSGKTSCRFKFDFIHKKISFTSASRSESDNYDFDVKPEELPWFSLLITSRANNMFMMSFVTKTTGQSNQLFCKINNSRDINQIDIKDGVASVSSLLFKF